MLSEEEEQKSLDENEQNPEDDQLDEPTETHEL